MRCVHVRDAKYALSSRGQVEIATSLAGEPRQLESGRVKLQKGVVMEAFMDQCQGRAPIQRLFELAVFSRRPHIFQGQDCPIRACICFRCELWTLSASVRWMCLSESCDVMCIGQATK